MSPEIVNLVKLIPDGLSVIAVIVVVILFLRQQDKSNEVITSLSDKQENLISQMMQRFNESIEKGRSSYQEQISKLANQNTDSQRQYQDQIQQMLQSHFKITKESIEALKTLETTISTFKEQFTSYVGRTK